MWHVRAFGEHADYDLLAAPLRAGEGGPRAAPARALAWRLWSPLLEPIGGNEQIRGLWMETFDITARPAPGITLLEASAGTGKTWTIAALVTKHVADGRGRARRDARRHLHPGGQPGAARAGARPARRGRAGARRPAAPRARQPAARLAARRPTPARARARGCAG